MLTINDLSASKKLDRAAMGAVAGGNGFPSLFQSNYANDLFDIVGAVYQSDVTAITNVGNHGSLVFNYVKNEKAVIV